MLESKYRLKYGFDSIYKRGYKVKGEYGMLLALEDEKLSNSVFGTVANKKVGKANQRNKLKRRLGHIIQNLINEGRFAEYKLMFLYIAFQLPPDYDTLQSEVNHQFEKILENFNK